MDFLSKLINRPKSFILTSADPRDNVLPSDPIIGNSENEAQQRSTPKKPSNFDVDAIGDDNSKQDTSEVDNKNQVNDKIGIGIQEEGENNLDKSKEHLKDAQQNFNNSTSILPDIVNVQPVLVAEETDDSLISSVTNNLNCLNLNSKGDTTLTVPTSTTCDAISSDEEIFAECQTYTDNSILLETNENHSIHWDVVLSNVTSSNLENIDNTIEQVEQNFELDTQQEIGIVSVAKNNLITCNDDQIERIEANIDANDIQNQNVNLKTFCKEAFSICIDDQNLNTSSSEPENQSDLLNKTEELNETITQPNKINSNQNEEFEQCPYAEKGVNSVAEPQLETTIKVIQCDDDETLNSSGPLRCTDSIDMLEKCSADELNNLTQNNNNTLDPKVSMKQENEMRNAQKSNSNQTMMIATEGNLERVDDINSQHDISNRPSSTKNKKPSGRAIPTMQKSKYATYRIKRQPERMGSVEEVPQPINTDENGLNTTYGLNSDVLLNTTVVVGDKDESFNAIQLNGTFDANALRSSLNDTVEMTSPLIDKTTSSTSPPIAGGDNLGIDMSKTIVVSKGNVGVNDIEPMDVDVSTTGESSNSTFAQDHVASTQDVFVDNVTDAMNITFKSPTIPSTTVPIGKRRSLDEPSDSDFEGHGIILNPSDFDYLLTKGSNTVPVDDRNSLLLRFDPLLGHSIPVNQSGINNQNRTTSKVSSHQNLIGRLSPAAEEEELHGRVPSAKFVVQSTENKEESNVAGNIINCDYIDTTLLSKTVKIESVSPLEREPLLTRRFQGSLGKVKKNDKMSVDVIQDIKIENDSKSEENLSPKLEEKEDNKMDDMEKKIKNEVLKTEDIEKKLKDAEQREEALLKRITEKDKSISKMSGVIEAYEKAIAELIAEKEQIIQNYEKQMSEIKSERDRNYQHLTSLETTFSDLHVKYERSKELTAKLEASEEDLKAEKKQNLENLRLQEQRYEKMKNHAIKQLEIANNKLESLTKDHSMEVTRLKALLKKEEISRLSINEQLQQKSRENEELMKICDELINGQGASS